MMPKLSQNAQQSLDEYRSKVNISLKGVKSVDFDEVVQNINEHIENELTGCPEPVSSEDLNIILEKLGSPFQWVPEEDIAWWKKFALRLRTGPEDWRLAYLSFGLFIIGFLFSLAFILLVPASYLVSRAAMSLSNYNIQVKAQKWLIYPSLILVTLVFAVALLLVPLFVLVPVAENLEHTLMETHNIDSDDHYWYLATSVIGMLTCLWCILEGIICLIYPSLPRKLFFPMAEWFKRKHALILMVLACAVFSIFLAIWTYSIQTYLD
ncbi:hypothetical protein ACFLZ8_06660 [Planctomycetota bacterium]